MEGLRPYAIFSPIITVQAVNALVVDDEGPARAWLTALLRATGQFGVIEGAESCLEARRIISASTPDVIFLDIDMPLMSGMEFATSQPNLPPIVFVTAHEEFAVQAFETQAIDYLLKPVAPPRLKQALDRLHYFRRDISRGAGPLRGNVLLAVKYRNEHRLIDAGEISHFLSDGGYVRFSHGGFDYVLDETMQSLANRLRRFDFVRVGRHALVNLGHVAAVKRCERRVSIRLHDGITVPVSRRVTADLKKKLDHFLAR